MSSVEVKVPDGLIADAANQYQNDTGQVLDPRAFVRMVNELAAALREQPEARGVVDEAMVDAYLAAQAKAVQAVDDKWGGGGKAASYLHPVREACRAGLTAALTAAQQPGQEGGGEVCPRCKGAGEYEGFARHASGDPQDEYAATVQCEPCEGTGEVAAPPSAPVGVEAAVEHLKDRAFPNHQCPAESSAVWNVALYEMANFLTQQPAQAAPGWKLVPVEPTPEMLDSCALDRTWDDMRKWWSRWLAAAPTPPGDDAAGGA